MSAARQRREKSKRLALDLQTKYRALVEAKGQDGIQDAAIVLGDCFNQNIEFIINVLRDYGGLEAKFEPMTKQPAILRSANDTVN
jgi:hypothetical protein